MIGLGTLVRIPQLLHSLAGDDAFRQTQTAFGAREFAVHGIQLLHGPLPVFGTASDVPMEFPLFQAIARLLMYAGPDAATTSRIAGLAGFQAAAALWWLLLQRWHGATLATTTLVMFETLPFGLHWGAASLIDFFSVALGLAMVYGFDVWLHSSTWRRWAGFAACALGGWALFLVKVTSVPGMGLLLVLATALASTRQPWPAVRSRAITGLAAGPLIGLILLSLWTRHADHIKQRYTATEFLTSKNLIDWNFGGSRFDPHEWHSVLVWADGGTIGYSGSVLLVGVALGVAADRRTRILTIGLLVTAVAPVLIFFNLFVVHPYYQSAVYPSLVALGAVGVVTLWQICGFRSKVLVVLPIGLVIFWFATTTFSDQGRHNVDLFLHERSEPPQVSELEAVTPAGARIVTVGCDWDPQILFFANRRGLMMREAAPQLPPRIWQQNRISDYRYLVRCSRAVDPAGFLPTSTTLEPTSEPDVFRLIPPPSAK